MKRSILRKPIFAALALGLASATAVPVLAKPAATASASAPYVRPDVQAYLDTMAKNPRPQMNDAFIAQVRKIPAQVMAQMMGTLDAPIGTIAVDRMLTMQGPAGPMSLRLFDARADRGPGPVLVFYHGGGFVVGSVGTHAALAAEMARKLDVPVVSVEYRLAPEHKWPAAPDDAEAAARWIAANGAQLGRQADSLILSGDSAGGTLTLLTAIALRDKPAAVPVRMMIPLYPMTDASRPYPSMTQFSTGNYGLPKADMDYYGKAYGAKLKSPRHSALLNDLRGLPPTVLATASLDPLRDGGRAFAAKLLQAGVPVNYYEAQGVIHGYATFRRAIPSAQGDLDTILAMAKSMMEAK
ncbi:alpha/beta hydrolase fold domain-containing protein [Novosphingobium sp. TH158]|uniref:alpha/beta hydrolase fold domain-containing protein n=1 Tax=Novosphingobium sp. TH158 TaxID=2067455 RepID=UPI000C7A9FEE|nr:alpha/beta hydrolase fold domain-containing protein [Novosphingobium sp. TH158]PLK26298.1 lipase [Novosphingobium sp. TH158]